MKYFLLSIQLLLLSCSSIQSKMNPSLTAHICEKVENGHYCGTVYNLKVDGNTYGVTNAHVCQSYKDKMIMDYKFTRYKNVKVLLIMDKIDICIVNKIDHIETLYPAKVTPKVNDMVYTQGYPNGMFTASYGKIEHFDHMITHEYDQSIVAITNFIVGGASGSPVLNTNGKVIGTIGYSNIMTNTGVYIELSNYLQTIKGL